MRSWRISAKAQKRCSPMAKPGCVDAGLRQSVMRHCVPGRDHPSDRVDRMTGANLPAPIRPGSRSAHGAAMAGGEVRL